MVSNRFQDYLPVVTQLLNQSGGSGYNYNPVAPTSVQGGIVQTGTRQNPTIRPAIPVSGPNQQIPRTVGTITDPGMVGRNVDLSGAYELNPGEVVVDGRVVSKDAATGLWGNIAGAADWVTGNRFDIDKKGSPTTAAAGGLGREATLDPAKVAEIEKQITGVDPLNPTTSPVLSPQDAAEVLRQDNAYRRGSLQSIIEQRQAHQNQTMNELRQMMPFFQDQILGARLATEARSPSEIMSRQLMAKRGGVLDSEIAKNYGAANLMWQQGTNMAPRRFG